MRPGDLRKKKYEKKLDGTISQLRLLRYQHRQKERFKSQVPKQVEIERTVKGLIAESAPSILIHFYCDFAKKAVQLSRTHKGSNLINELEILDKIWETRGLDTFLLSSIKGHFIPSYPVLKLYERYNTGDNTTTTFYGVNWKGQTFTIGNTGPNEDHNITFIMIKVYRLGNPGTLTASIRNVDGAGKPTGGDLTLGTIDGNTFTDSPLGAWYKIPLTKYTLSANVKYAIVVRVPAGDVNNKIYWCDDTTGPTYTGGCYVYSGDSGVTWFDLATIDCMFEEWGSKA